MTLYRLPEGAELAIQSSDMTLHAVQVAPDKSLTDLGAVAITGLTTLDTDLKAASINTVLTTTAAGDTSLKTGNAATTGPTKTIANLPLARYLYWRIDVVVTGTLDAAGTAYLYAIDPNAHCADAPIPGASVVVPTAAGTYSYCVVIDCPGASTQVYYYVTTVGTLTANNYFKIISSLEGIAN